MMYMWGGAPMLENLLGDSRYWSAALTELQRQSPSTPYEEYILKELKGINQDCHGEGIWMESHVMKRCFSFKSWHSWTSGSTSRPSDGLNGDIISYIYIHLYN